MGKVSISKQWLMVAAGIFAQPSVRVVAGVVYRLAAHSLGVVAAGVGPGPDRRTGAGPRG